MSDTEQVQNSTKDSIIRYVENFIEKRDNELRTTTGDTLTSRGIDKDTIVIQSGHDEYQRDRLVVRPFVSILIVNVECNRNLARCYLV
jgi:acetoin utilization deacetylase AcuC-like enzyme